MTTILDILDKLDIKLQPHQEEARQDVAEQVGAGLEVRLCLYHRTGAGKTIGSLVCVAQAGVRDVLVLAPPVTHNQWVDQGRKLGLNVFPMSHAKFRMKSTKLHRKQAIIVDEFHLLGGHTGQGWKKLDALARGLQAPLILCSATPNYNDVERVYCVAHVLDPAGTKGGYIAWLYKHCETEVNPFGQEPKVVGLLHHADAEAMLASLPYVHYLEDEVIKTITIGSWLVNDVPEPEHLDTYGYSARGHRIMASQMEERHTRNRWMHLDDRGQIRVEVYDAIAMVSGVASGPMLVYCNSSTIARALHNAVLEHGASSLLVTGDITASEKLRRVAQFKEGQHDVLIGTATLATGTDGLDKMCDTLLIVDDTDDDSLRRQLMGRILPRGLDTDASAKQVWRLQFS